MRRRLALYTLAPLTVNVLPHSLIIFSSQNHVMSIPITPIKLATNPSPAATVASARLQATSSGASPLWKKRSLESTWRVLNPFRRRRDPDGHVSFANAPSIIWLASGESPPRSRRARRY